MEAKGIGVARVKRAAVALFAMLALAFAVASSEAQAAKVNNPSPPNFRAQVTGGYLQFIGTSGTPLQLPLDFGSFDPPLPNPTLTGTVTTNAQRYGVINIPQAGVTFPPIPVNVDDIALTVRMLPVVGGHRLHRPAHRTGRPQHRRSVSRPRVPPSVRASATTATSVPPGNPINLNTTTHNGTFPTTNPPPAQTTYVADFVPADGFDGGWLAAQPYTEDAGTWPVEPKQVPGKPVGTTPKPTPDEIPYNELTDYIPRAAGAWRGMNETLAAPAAAGCGTGLLAGVVNDQVNSLIGLPSAAGASTASLDFKWVAFSGGRTGDDAIVQKGVKSNFTAPGISADPWLTTQTPTAVSAQTVSSMRPAPASSPEWAVTRPSVTRSTSAPARSVPGPRIRSAASPLRPSVKVRLRQNLNIRVKVKDAESDEDISVRRLKVVPATDITLSTSVSSLAGAKFRAGSAGHVKFDVTNTLGHRLELAADHASTANLPSGVTLTNLDSPAAWTCNTTSSTISCTIPQGGLAANEVDQFDATVDVATGTANPANITASAVMAGDPAPGNNNNNFNAQVVKTDLTVDLTRTSPLVANGWTPYEIDVSNAGDGETVGGSTVEVELPADFSYRSIGSGGAGLDLYDPGRQPHVSCARTAEIAGNASAPLLTVVAKVDRTAAAVPSTVSAAVSTAG